MFKIIILSVLGILILVGPILVGIVLASDDPYDQEADDAEYQRWVEDYARREADKKKRSGH